MFASSHSHHPSLSLCVPTLPYLSTLLALAARRPLAFEPRVTSSGAPANLSRYLNTQGNRDPFISAAIASCAAPIAHSYSRSDSDTSFISSLGEDSNDTSIATSVSSVEDHSRSNTASSADYINLDFPAKFDRYTHKRPTINMSSLLGRHINSVRAAETMEDMSPDIQYAARPALPLAPNGHSSYNPSPTHSHMSVATPDLSLNHTSVLPPPHSGYASVGFYGSAASDFYPQSAPASNSVFRLNDNQHSRGFPQIDTSRVLSSGMAGPASNSVSPVLPPGNIDRPPFNDNDSDLSRSIPNDSFLGEPSSLQYGSSMMGTSMQQKANARRIFISPQAYNQQIAAPQSASTAGMTTASSSMHDSMHGPPTAATTVPGSAMAESFSTHKPPTPPIYAGEAHSAPMSRNYSHESHQDSLIDEHAQDVKHTVDIYANPPQTAPLPVRASSFDEESAAALLSQVPHSAHYAGASSFSHRPFPHIVHTAAHCPTSNVLQAQAAYDSYVAEAKQDHSVTLSTGPNTASSGSSNATALPAPGGPWSVGFPTAANYAAYGMYAPGSMPGMNGRECDSHSISMRWCS